MTTAVERHPAVFAGLPLSSWAFAIRIWLAIVLALYISFWLELEAPSSAAVTVTILALPTRGQVLEKAVFRLMATVIGVAASITIVGLSSQTGTLHTSGDRAWHSFGVARVRSDITICNLAARLLVVRIGDFSSEYSVHQERVDKRERHNEEPRPPEDEVQAGRG